MTRLDTYCKLGGAAHAYGANVIADGRALVNAYGDHARESDILTSIRQSLSSLDKALTAAEAAHSAAVAAATTKAA
jgi:hypothetical protein